MTCDCSASVDNGTFSVNSDGTGGGGGTAADVDDDDDSGGSDELLSACTAPNDGGPEAGRCGGECDSAIDGDRLDGTMGGDAINSTGWTIRALE